jgi:sulfite reductase (NADPH) flavoprotein alpha-component
VKYTKQFPLEARLAWRRRLSKEGSDKCIYSLGIATDGEISHKPGDWLAVFPKNDPQEVERLWKLVYSKNYAIVDDVFRALQGEVSITRVPIALAHWLQENGVCGDRRGILEDWLANGFAEKSNGHSVADFLEKFAEIIPSPAVLLPLLKKLQPRLYSIASSPLKDPSIVELLISTECYVNANGQVCRGVASSFLNERLSIGENVKIFSVSTPFSMPTNPQVDLICVGPGVGLSPFMGFLQHRECLREKGELLSKFWLFFGDRHRNADFIFQEELEGYVQRGILDRLDLAFSRDQREKVYVQDRLRLQGREVFQWLQGGAHFYVCGSAASMGTDVENTLVDIFEKHGAFSREKARAQVTSLRKERRYQLDVY